MVKRWMWLLLVVLVLPLAWWLGSPLFLNNEVDEAFPFDLPSAEVQAGMSTEEIETKISDVMTLLSEEGALEALSDEEKALAEERLMALASSVPDKAMADEMPVAEWVLAASASFEGADAFHKGSGSAKVFQQGDESILRFEDFSSTNGPDLHVLLVENIEGRNSADLGDYIDLGSLKGNVGNQNYELPAGLDLSLYEGVVIYCMPFHVVFSTAAFE